MPLQELRGARGQAVLNAWLDVHADASRAGEEPAAERAGAAGPVFGSHVGQARPRLGGGVSGQNALLVRPL